jgi:hypothetical protein
MRFYEFANADEKLELWGVIVKSVLQALDQPTSVRKTPSAKAKPKPRTPTKGEFKHRGTEIAAANARDDIDPNAHAAEQLHQVKQQQVQYQQALNNLRKNAAIKPIKTQ